MLICVPDATNLLDHDEGYSVVGGHDSVNHDQRPCLLPSFCEFFGRGVSMLLCIACYGSNNSTLNRTTMSKHYSKDC